ncbi:unnamed protein product [Calypogeia fissa]
MDNVWERLAQLQMRQMSEIAHRRSFQKYNHRASDASFADLCRPSLGDCNNFPIMKNCRLNEPSVLDRPLRRKKRPNSTKDGEQEAEEDEEEEIEEPIMDTAVWKNLPENLVERIFPFLPLHSLLRFRAVCKRWKALLHCPTFLQCWHRGPSVKREPPWLIFRGSARECVAYIPSLDRWSKIPLSFLPSPRVRVVASAGGLLCVRRRDDSLMVLNPFTKTYLSLSPKLCKWKYPIVGMVATDRNSDANGEFSFKIIVAGSHGVPTPDLTTEVYDSSSHSWSFVGSRPLRHHFQVNAVHFNGFLYSAGFSVIMVYDLEKQIWTEMAGPPVTQHTNLIMPHICECRGKLLMVEVVSERFVMRRVSIWANDRNTRGYGNGNRHDDGKWVMIATMPDDLLGEVIVMSNSRFFSYFGHEDLLCFVIARREILAYEVSTSRWRWLPSCPYVQGFAQRFAAFAFHPTLEACK